MSQTAAADQQTAERSRLYHWQDPLIGAGAAQGFSGLEYLRGEYPAPPTGQTPGFPIASEDDVQPGRVTFRMRPEEYHHNPIGRVHGGVYAMPELKVNSLRPLKLGMAEVHAVGEVLSVSRQVATARAQLLDDQGKLDAHATTCLILRPGRETEAGR